MCTAHPVAGLNPGLRRVTGAAQDGNGSGAVHSGSATSPPWATAESPHGFVTFEKLAGVRLTCRSFAWGSTMSDETIPLQGNLYRAAAASQEPPQGPAADRLPRHPDEYPQRPCQGAADAPLPAALGVTVRKPGQPGSEWEVWTPSPASYVELAAQLVSTNLQLCELQAHMDELIDANCRLRSELGEMTLQWIIEKTHH